MEKKPRILVCPLDWGLGHATRCVPVINELLRQNAEVLIAADNRPLYFLKKEFPGLETIKFPGFNVRYPSGGNMALKMALSAPAFFFHIYRENRKLKKLIREYGIDGVVSDNRFGLWSNEVPCVYLTHQVNIITPFLGFVVNFINHLFINNFTECWIPDNPGFENLSGRLSGRHKKPTNAVFIGPLSRFKPVNISRPAKKFDIVAILSGPEPQRTIFETKLVAELRRKALKAAIVRGVTEAEENYTMGNLHIYSHLSTPELQELLESSEIVISRPGYSTLMDLAVLRKKAVFVPTPGQTEQEYLGRHIAKKGMGIFMSQDKFNIDSLFMQEVQVGPVQLSAVSVLKERVSFFLKASRGK